MEEARVDEAVNVLSRLEAHYEANEDGSLDGVLSFNELRSLKEVISHLQTQAQQRDVYKDMVDTFMAHPDLFDGDLKEFFEATYTVDGGRGSRPSLGRGKTRSWSLNMRRSNSLTASLHSLDGERERDEGGKLPVRGRSLGEVRVGLSNDAVGGTAATAYASPDATATATATTAAAAPAAPGGEMACRLPIHLKTENCANEGGDITEIVGAELENAMQGLKPSPESGSAKKELPTSPSQAAAPFLEKKQNSLKKVMMMGGDASARMRAHETLGKFYPSKIQLIMRHLQNLRRADFDVFELQRATPDVLTVVATAAISELSLVQSLRLDAAKMVSFFRAIQQLYLPNLYHNAMHGADITQTCFHMLTSCGVSDALELQGPKQLALLFAAAVHDVGHPGVNNRFLTRTNDELALTYNDCSPLENMHASTAFKALRLSGNNFMEGSVIGEDVALSERFRAEVIHMVLMTDNDQHGACMADIAALNTATAESPQLLHNGLLDPADRQEVILVTLQVVLHAADVGNPAKEWTLYQKWTDMIMGEFYEQGDREREAGLTVSYALDRHAKVPLPKFQRGFITAIVMPLYTAFGDLPQIDMSHQLQRLQENLNKWEEVG